MIRLLRAKLFHFFVLGLALYGLNTGYTAYEQRQLVCPTADELDAMVAVWAQQNRQPITTVVRQALGQSALDEQMLVREAQLKGLHKRDNVVLQRLLRDAEFLGIEGDRASQLDAVLAMGLLESDEVIRRRLIQLQEHQVTADVSAQNPSEQDLRRLAAVHPQLSQRPPRYSFEQRFFAGDSLAQQQSAARLMAQLNNDESPISSDVFLGGESFTRMTAAEISRIFGPGFWFDALTDVNLYRWIGPRKSVYGWHLINLHEIVPGAVRSFEEMRPELELIWRQDLQRRSWQVYVARLREQYRVSCSE